jgi:HEXXH motif-containing protein
VWAAAASALHLNAAGRYGTWEASFIRPISLRWGTLCTPPLRRVTVSKQGNLSKLTLFGDDGVESSVDLGTHVPVELPRNWRMLEGIDIFDQRILILDSESTAYLPLPNLSVTRSQEPTARIVATLHGAVELIREVSAEYASWVENAVWAVVPALRPGESGYSSGSMTGIHGIIYESFPVSPIVAAEGLIHEASHQYYHLGQLETLFSNGEDARLYWSPYARRDRPVDRILLAFHAFANVTLFYQGCLRADAASVTERANHEIATHTRNLRSMGAVLERSPGLTSDGRALFKVLHERLFR